MEGQSDDSGNEEDDKKEFEEAFQTSINANANQDGDELFNELANRNAGKISDVIARSTMQTSTGLGGLAPGKEAARVDAGSLLVKPLKR